MKMGREEPAVSMDNTGKIVWAKHSEIQQANVKALTSAAGESAGPGSGLFIIHSTSSI